MMHNAQSSGATPWLQLATTTAGLLLGAYLFLKLGLFRRVVANSILRFFAWHSDRIAKQHKQVPSLLKLYKENYETMESVLGALPGPVLELGAGPGSNLPFFPAGTELITCDLNAHFHPYLRENLKANPHVTLKQSLECNAQDMRGVVADESVSCVVSSLLLCCVDQHACLQEVRRVLKPGGRFFFKEHILEDPGTFTHWFQRYFTPYWAGLRGNCHLDKQTDAVIPVAEGFSNMNAKIVYREIPTWNWYCAKTFIGYMDKVV